MRPEWQKRSPSTMRTFRPEKATHEEQVQFVAYKQLRDDAVHVCGMEEQRGTFTGVTCSDGYILAHSAADDGKGGCLLAESATLDFAHGNGKSDLHLGVVEENVSIIVAEHRCTFVRITAPLFQALAIALHGLHESYGIEAVTA